MLAMIRRSLSGDSQTSKSAETGHDSREEGEIIESQDVAKWLETRSASGKRYRSGDSNASENPCSSSNGYRGSNKKKKLHRQHRKNFSSLSNDDISDLESDPGPPQEQSAQQKTQASDAVLSSLPADTPEWGKMLIEIFQLQFNTMNTKISAVEENEKRNTKNVKRMERKLAYFEEQNTQLKEENVQLREKLLDLEYQQKCNNLLFDGLPDEKGESDLQIISKLRIALKGIPGLDVGNFRIDRCHRIDGSYKPGMTRRVLCCFNWHYDVQCILRNRKKLPRSVNVAEDMPEIWNDRRKILKPIFNATKRNDSLKSSTKLTKDRLTIDGHTFTVGPKNNLGELNSLLDVSATCQKID